MPQDDFSRVTRPRHPMSDFVKAALTERGNTDSVNLMRRVGLTVDFNPDPDAVYPRAVGIIENMGEGDG